MMKEIIWSHSKLSTLLNCPMIYNISYNHKIFPKFEKEALSLGSAVHYGIEHDIDNLEEYYKEKNKFKVDERILAESMVSGYLTHKDELFKIILDEDELLDEEHELEICGTLPSNLIKQHKFMGVIDLLLLTNKGFIVVDYKTSSGVPEWSNYLDQLYRYIYLLNCEFPDTPVYKIAIINLRKCKVKRKTGENDNSFRKRLDVVYQLNDENHIDVHVFKNSEIDLEGMNSYIKNLSKQCDAALSIINSNSYYINYKALDEYGGSPFKELILNNEGSYTLYNIKDVYFNELTNEVQNFRDMTENDVNIINNSVESIDRYEKFQNVFDLFIKYNKINNKDLIDNFIDISDKFINYVNEYLKIICDFIDVNLIKNYLHCFYIFKLQEERR